MCLSKIKNNGILLVTLLFLCTVILGIIGYMAIEHYSLLESIYLTISTVTTMGFDFSGIHPLSSMGKMFSIILMLFGATAFVFAAGFLADWFFSKVTASKPESSGFASDLDFFKGSKEDMRLAIAKMPSSMTKREVLEKHNVVIIALAKGEYFDVNVPFSSKLKEGTTIIIFGTEKQIRAFC